jgi:hypothetical protein
MSKLSDFINSILKRKKHQKAIDDSVWNNLRTIKNIADNPSSFADFKSISDLANKALITINKENNK